MDDNEIRYGEGITDEVVDFIKAQIRYRTRNGLAWAFLAFMTGKTFDVPVRRWMIDEIADTIGPELAQDKEQAMQEGKI